METALSSLSLLEYRIRAVAIGHLALRYSMTWDEVPSMTVYFDDVQVMEGSATGFTNGAIESAVIHCRALLEFMGLGAGATATTLRELTSSRRREDDDGVEFIDGLNRVTIAEAVASYAGEEQEAQAALAFVAHIANKGLAHMSRSFSKHDAGARLLEIAFRGVPILVCNKVYVRLGLEPPQYKPQGRKRAGT